MIVDRKITDALYRVNFGAFAYAAYEIVHPHEPLCPNWHIDRICHHLAAMEAGRIPARLIVNLPPLSEVFFGVSCLGRVAAGSQTKPSDHMRQLFGRACA
jgi:hypothetical protein